MRRLAFLLALVALPATAQDRPVVAVVNYPLAYFAERLGGDAVEVLFPVPDGVDPAFWRPGIADIAAMQAADLIALNGAGFAQWTTKASLPRSRLVDTSSGFSEAYIATETVTHSHGEGGEHSHTGTATHTWLDFEQAAAQAEALAVAMARRVPPAAEGLEARLAALQADLAELDTLAEQAGAALAGRTIVASHPRYQYFARAYGLDIAALEWEAGDMPTDEDWADLQSLLAGSDGPLLIWEADPPAEAIARAADMGVTSVVFPPLANRPASEGDFLTAMRAVMTRLAAMSG